MKPASCLPPTCLPVDTIAVALAWGLRVGAGLARFLTLLAAAWMRVPLAYSKAPKERKWTIFR